MSNVRETKLGGVLFSKYLVLFFLKFASTGYVQLITSPTYSPSPAHVVGADTVMVGRAASAWKISIIFQHFGLLSRFKKHNSGRYRVCAPSQIIFFACHPLFLKIRRFFIRGSKRFHSKFNMAPADGSWSRLFDPSCRIQN